MISIIDYGLGNPRAIKNILGHIGFDSIITSDATAIRTADKLILPGVGAFDEGMRNLRTRELVSPLEEAVLERNTPILGICLGMQLFSKSSEEGVESGLGWIDAHTVRFRFEDITIKEKNLKIPHMGWSVVRLQHNNSVLCRHLSNHPRFYFVHAYYVQCESEVDVLGSSVYGYPFTAMIENGRIFGTQFHPEKSHRYGMQILQGFAEIK
jgi:glutamine amidotransferase